VLSCGDQYHHLVLIWYATNLPGSASPLTIRSIELICIPSSFKLGGRTWDVQYVPLIDDDPNIYGDCDGSEAVIRLKSGAKPEVLQHTFYHELSHAICFTLGWKKLNKNEDDIDALGGMYYQYLKSKRGKVTNPE
jgi:hypothetical protein